MKKVLFGLAYFILCFAVLIPNAMAKGKAVYVFSKEGCPNCETIETYFNSLLADDKDLFDFFVIEVVDAHGNFESEEARDLMVATLEHFGHDTNNVYFPTIIIGDSIHVGAGNKEELLAKINEYNEDEDAKDIVKDLANTLDIKLDSLRRLEPEEKAKQEGKYDAIILIGIFALLIGGFAGFVILGRK